MAPQNRKISNYAADGYDNPIYRYQSLALKEFLSKPSQYASACKDLSFLLKIAYSKSPKSLQSLIFQDTLFAFTILPQMQTPSAILAANSLLQSAKFALPKQKRALAVTEYKCAVVASKRKSKTIKEEGGLVQVSQDVLVHIFSFLDVQSLLSASAVCGSWNAAAFDNYLWKVLYDTYFNNSATVKENNGLQNIGEIKNADRIHLDDNIFSEGRIDFRNAFKAAYKDSRYRKFKSYRGYCLSCSSVVWLDRNKCSNKTNTRDVEDHKIIPISLQKIVDFVLGGSLTSESSSDSDTDDEDESVFRLWVYPRQIM